MWLPLPKDPVILLSYVNTSLRDYGLTLSQFCAKQNVPEEELIQSLSKINYSYDPATRQFLAV